MGKQHVHARWHREDVRQLSELLGEMPAEMVAREFNDWARQHGRPERTLSSIRHKSKILGISLVPDGSWVQIRYAAEMLDRSVHCLQLWVADGRIRALHGVIERESIRELARREPLRFFGCPRQGLLDLLEDERLVTWLVRQKPRSGRMARRPQPVIRVDTGEWFPSIGMAAKAAFIHPSTLHRAIRLRKKACGLSFRLAE